jgi:hypothetical protein
MGIKAPHRAKKFLFWAMASTSGTVPGRRSLFISESLAIRHHEAEVKGRKQLASLPINEDSSA